MSVRVLVGDARQLVLAPKSVRCCVTSPPYWGLRDYGTARWDGGDPECSHTPNAAPRRSRPTGQLQGGKSHVDAGTVHRDCHCGAVRVDAQLGLERTPEEYVASMVAVFRSVRDVLTDDGTLWLNLGDSYVGAANSGGAGKQDTAYRAIGLPVKAPAGVRAKNLVGIPWRVAFALQADGWYLRSDIIWSKPNPMPESVTDRPTKAHEYVFLLSKSERYYYDADAIAEPIADATANDRVDTGRFRVERGFPGSPSAGSGRLGSADTRNARTVWEIATQPYSGAHFATMPPELARRCILAGSAKGDTVLDPFGGAGTTGLVADRLGRDAILMELNPKYAQLAERRIRDDAPLFADVETDDAA